MMLRLQRPGRNSLSRNGERLEMRSPPPRIRQFELGARAKACWASANHNCNPASSASAGTTRRAPPPIFHRTSAKTKRAQIASSFLSVNLITYIIGPPFVTFTSLTLLARCDADEELNQDSFAGRLSDRNGFSWWFCFPEQARGARRFR